MKQIKLILILFITASVLLGCGRSRTYEVHGLENYSEYDSDFGFAPILPGQESFLSMFPYESGDYDYVRYIRKYTEEKLFVRLTYTEEVYQQAKQYCEETQFFDDTLYLYEDYIFRVRIGEKSRPRRDFCPPAFGLMGYSDSKNTIIYIEYSNLEFRDPNYKLAESDFAAFFEQTYGEFMPVQETTAPDDRIIFVSDDDPSISWFYPELYTLCLASYPIDLQVAPIENYLDAGKIGEELWADYCSTDNPGDNVRVFYIPQEDVWIVEGTSPDVNWNGWVPVSIIQSDGKVLAVGIT